jgi:hypothetical protein
MIFRYRGAPAMPDTDAKVIAAMKDAWLREIFPSTSADGRDDRAGVAVIAGPRDSQQAELVGQRVRIAHHQSVAPLIAQARRKRRGTS